MVSYEGALMGILVPPTHSPQQIADYFYYDPEEGTLTRTKGYGRAVAGAVINGKQVSFGDRTYIVSRVCWCLYYGEWPPDDMLVDHKNRIKAVNKIGNLRLATPQQNQYNKSGSGTYPKGVVWKPRRRPWCARIRINGVKVHLGSFYTMAAAYIAYRDACELHHGEFACPT